MKNKKQVIYSRYLQDKKTFDRVFRWGDILAQMTFSEGKPEALSGTMVLDLSYASFPGIVMASFLAELGAEVIKIEPPEGDPSRMFTPWGKNIDGVGIPFLMEGRNKYYITLDLEDRNSRENLKTLAAKADIIIETFAPGEMDSLEIGYRHLQEINPGLIYVAITPYGHFSKKAKELSRIPWAELTSQAESGLNAIIGELPDEPEPYSWPTRVGFYAACYLTGTAAAIGALTALFYKQTTGEGQMVDVASSDAFVSCVGFPATMGYIWKKPRLRYGTLDYGLCPYGFFKCKDAYVAIACFRDQDFRAALKILGRWDLERDWRDLLDRITDDIDKAKELNQEIEKAIAKYSYEQIYQKFAQYSSKAARLRWRGGGLPVTTRMMTPKEVLGHKHWDERNVFIKETQPFGELLVPLAGKMSQTPPRIKWLSSGIGQDNIFIWEKYGLKRVNI
jgi:CoA:oxalate CoA-transferase